MRGRVALAVGAMIVGIGLAAPAVAAPSINGTGSTMGARDVTDPTPAPEVACRAVLTITAQWSSGYQGVVTVTNISTVPIRWRVIITFPDGTTITLPPGFVVTRSGSSWWIYPPAWNEILPPGASTSVGFVASTTGMPTLPTVTCAATPA